MSQKDEFFIYLLEHYASHAGRAAGNVLAEWDTLGLTSLIYDMYERYHAEALENAFDDIDALVTEARG